MLDKKEREYYEKIIIALRKARKDLKKLNDKLGDE
jgi:hypothetical protein